MGGDNSNQQAGVQQMSRPRSNIEMNDELTKPVAGRRANSNSQIGVQQYGRGNSNKQESVQQHSRRSNMNSQTGVQQKGSGNSNSQSQVQQYGRRAMIVRDCPPFLDPSNCSRRMISARAGNSNVQKQVQQYGSGNSNEQSSVQQYSRRFSVMPDMDGQYQFGGVYEPIQPPVVWGGPDAYVPSSEYGLEGVGISSYPEMTLSQQNGILGGVYGSYQQGLVAPQVVAAPQVLGGPQVMGGSSWGQVVPEYSSYGNNLAYGGQYQQPNGLGYIQAQSPYGREVENFQSHLSTI